MCWSLLNNFSVLRPKKVKATRISYLVVKEQNFDGISIRVFCGYSDFEPGAQAQIKEFAKKIAWNSRHWTQCAVYKKAKAKLATYLN